jgi:uncharacterized protein (TIGR00255 family)
MKSMTGYGQGSNEHFVVEIKSLNHRFCEINVKPIRYSWFENRIREEVRRRINRGKLDVFIKENEGSESELIPLNIDLAKKVVKSFKELSAEIGVECNIKVSDLLQLPWMIDEQRSISEMDRKWCYLKDALRKAVSSLEEMRLSEGLEISLEVRKRIENIKSLAEKISKHAPKVVKEYKQKLAKRIDELMEGEKLVNENRLNAELAIYADKSDITEELVRLSSHLLQFEKILERNEPVGRQLEFLSQELNREMNTINSKTGELYIIHKVIQMKGELERIRELIQNVE